MSIDALLSNVTPEVFERLKTAVEIGKWPDGVALTDEQKAQSLQLVMAYQSKVLKSEEQFSVGEDGLIVNKSKAELKAQFANEEIIASFDKSNM